MRQLLFQLRTSAGADHSLKLLSLYFASTAITCQNEEQPKASRESDASNYKNLTLGQKIFHQIFRKDLPTPRLMTPSDPIFQSSQMKRCVKERKADEKRLARIQKDIITCAQAKDRQCIEANMQKVNEVLYGKGVTMQAREEFLMKYGCTPYDDKILDRILSFKRPIMDIGGEYTYFTFKVLKLIIKSVIHVSTSHSG
jgi:hypothetical protein